MNWLEAGRKAAELHEMWIGPLRGGRPDLAKIEEIIRSEVQCNRLHPARCSDSCKAETKGYLRQLGQIRKALS